MKKIKKVLALIIAICLFGCSNSQKERKIVVNGSYSGFEQFLSILMKEEEILEKYVPEGVIVEWSNITSGSEQRDAIISGNVDIAGISTLAFETAISNDMPLVYLGYQGCNLYQLYAADESILSIEDLKPNMKISVSSIGTGPHTAFLLAAQNDVNDTSRFKNSMITMSNSDAINALLSGTEGIDAVVCTFPTIVAAWNSDKVHLVRDLSDEIIDYGVGSILCTSKEFAEKNEDLLDSYLKAYAETIELLHNNQDECIKIMMSVYENIDYDTANMMLEYYIKSVDAGLINYDKLMNFLYVNKIIEKEAKLFTNVDKYVGK